MGILIFVVSVLLGWYLIHGFFTAIYADPHFPEYDIPKFKVTILSILLSTCLFLSLVFEQYQHNDFAQFCIMLSNSMVIGLAIKQPIKLSKDEIEDPIERIKKNTLFDVVNGIVLYILILALVTLTYSITKWLWLVLAIVIGFLLVLGRILTYNLMIAHKGLLINALSPFRIMLGYFIWCVLAFHITGEIEGISFKNWNAYTGIVASAILITIMDVY